MDSLEKKIEDTINEHFESLNAHSYSYHIAYELHCIYKEKGFYPSEFVEDITKVKLKINNWPDAIAAVKNFLDLSEESDAIH